MRERRGRKNRKIFDPAKCPEDPHPWVEYKKQYRNKNKCLLGADGVVPQVTVERVLWCTPANSSEVSARLPRQEIALPIPAALSHSEIFACTARLLSNPNIFCEPSAFSTQVLACKAGYTFIKPLCLLCVAVHTPQSF